MSETMTDFKKIFKQMSGHGLGGILVPHIDIYLAKAEFPEKWLIEIPNFKRDDGFYHPSSHTRMSPRFLYFDRLQARTNQEILPPNIVEPTLRRIFACGHMWHGYIQAMLVDMGFVSPPNVEAHYQKEIKTEHGSVTGSGTIDLLDVEIPGHGEWLIDIKTVNSREFHAGINEFTQSKWRSQVNCYGDWAGRDKMLILAIEKDQPHHLREIQIRRDEKLLDEIYTRWVYTEAHLEDGTPPPCDHGYGDDCLLGELCSYEGSGI